MPLPYGLQQIADRWGLTPEEAEDALMDLATQVENRNEHIDLCTLGRLTQAALHLKGYQKEVAKRSK